MVSVCWSEWAAPSGLEEHRRWLTEHLDDNPPPHDVRTAYEQLLTEAGSSSTRHEVLVTVTIDGGKVRPGRRHEGDRITTAVELLLTEMKLFSQCLQGAGLLVSQPLSPGEWARAMRLRLDPTCRNRLDARSRSLADTAGEVSLANAGPISAESTWTAWHTDGAWHRGLYVADWPRLDVPADWMRDLMLYNGAVRTVSVFFEPIPRSKSQRSITREAAKIESDAQQRAEKASESAPIIDGPPEPSKNAKKNWWPDTASTSTPESSVYQPPAWMNLRQPQMRSPKSLPPSASNFDHSTADTTRPSPPCSLSPAASPRKDDEHGRPLPPQLQLEPH